MNEVCNDNRFEVIAKYKQDLLDGTNIETSPDEMAVIDNILFRFWQMRWLLPTPRTNADRIRSMTDEELAEFIIGKSNCGACPNEEQCDDWHIGSCKDAWLNWLQEEVEE